MSELEQYKVNGYLPTIGIECHVQLKTKTKLFAAVNNDARGAKPNTLISHICLGMPGALPVLNEKAVEYAVRSAFAFNTKPQKYSYFERKHYFYPDLPKGYQITQLAHPIVVGGTVEIEVDGKKQTVQLNRVQMEEDAGKNTHPSGKEYSLVDLNRAGTPLLEIVSEADMHSAAQAKAYVKELYLLMRYADISDADLFHGNMRFDVNVSVSKDDQLGTRTETKNLNSFKSVEKATEFEIKRQIELLEKGETITQETRGWDDAKQKTVSQRGKEEAHDYRYMPEPDVPPIVLDETYVEDIKKTMPAMPEVYRSELRKLGVDESVIEVLIDGIETAKFVHAVLKQAGPDHAKRVAFWIANSAENISDDVLPAAGIGNLTVDQAVKLSELTQGNQISSNSAKEIWSVLNREGGDPLTIAKERDLLQVSDEGEIESIVKAVLDANPQAAQDVKNGEMKAIGFLVGQVMKESKGKANPGLAQKIIKDILNS